MGISRDSFHKRRKTGGKLTRWKMNRKYELGRQSSDTKIGHKRIRTVRTRGGNTKYRALRLDTGNFAWASESVIAKEMESQFNTGRLYACISSRPGQSGRCDGYILEGAELKFYLSKMSKKGGK